MMVQPHWAGFYPGGAGKATPPRDKKSPDPEGPGLGQPSRRGTLESPASSAEEAIRGQATRPISTGQLSALPRVHPRPIDLVIFQGPSEAFRPGEGSSRGGFRA